MTTDVRTSYFKWICKRINCTDNYTQLLWQMFHTEFHPIMMMDGNRYHDAIDMRYDYGYLEHVTNDHIKTCIDVYEPSILEVMAALAIRMENETMCDPAYGDRTGKWFWDMIESLGLEQYTDNAFDAGKVHLILQRFNSREYEPNGHGGLFTIDNPPQDMRIVEIWTQSLWKMSNYLKSE